MKRILIALLLVSNISVASEIQCNKFIKLDCDESITYINPCHIQEIKTSNGYIDQIDNGIYLDDECLNSLIEQLNVVEAKKVGEE